MARLAIEVLGGLDIRPADVGTALDLPTRKSKAFLAYLALSPGMLRSRAHLASTFWDRSAEEQARASLRQTLSSLRRALPKSSRPLIDADTDSVWLDSEVVDVDALRFEQVTAERSTASLERAAALYRGELLSGFSLVEEPFEQWLAAERRRLQERAVQALSELVGRYARADQFERGIAIAERLLVLDPLLEWAHSALMRLYSRAGRREAALRQYQECARILSRELGIAPAEETRRLAQEIGSETHGRSPDSTSRQTPTQDLYQHVAASEHDRSEPLPVLPAERKQLTVLCARIREAGDATDPEAVIARVDPALKAIVDSVRRFGGTISRVQGDGVTALFGAPFAQEDHAVRACYAALAMRDTVASFARTLSDIRIGIHAGEAIVRTIGDENMRHYEPIGPLLQVANQIDGVIAPGEIGLTADAARRAEGFIEISGPTRKRLDGASQAIELFTLQMKAPLRLRWDARSARGLTQFVGREAEGNRLNELLERAARGSGQVAAVVGEPGIGKSRLVHEFVKSPAVLGWTVLETGTISHETSATYLPLANLLRTWFDIGEREAQTVAAEKLRSGVEVVDPSLSSIVPALASILDLPTADEQWPTLSPAQQRQRTLQAVKQLILRASQVRPVILLIEDLHWVDAGTQAVLDHLVDSLVVSRVLLLVTHRPEYRHEWLAKSHFSHVRLDALTAESADRLLQALVGTDRQLVGLRKELVERTEGTPLFIEESVRELVDSGVLLGRPGAYRADRPIETYEIPSTVHAVIASRIDRLPATQKSLLQTAAVIGRDVPLELLQRIASLDRDLLLERLASLQSAEFLYQARLVPESQYTFKHALTHRVAYESILREPRRAVHMRLVDVIEALYADRLDEHVELLAHHALAGGQWVKAVQYLRRSAGKALQRSAHQQAIQYLDKGLEVIQKLPATIDKLRYELDYQKTRGIAMMAAKGWAAKEVLDAYTRARVLCEELHDERELFIVLRGEGQYRMIRGESKIARKLGERCVELAAGSKDVGVHIETHHLFWTNSFFIGDYAESDFHSAKGMALYERDRDHALTYAYSGHDPGVCCRCFAALIQCLYGHPDRSLAVCRDAVDLAQRLDHPLTTALAYWASSYVHMLRREPDSGRAWAERAIAECDEYLLPLLRSLGVFQHGWALAELGDLDKGIAHMREGLAEISATGAEMGSPFYAALLGEALGKAGEPRPGLEEIERALATARERGESFQLPEMLRLKGELLMRSKSTLPDAEACFRKAISTADKQGAVLSKLRATTSLARLLADKGGTTKARALLQPTVESITEGRDLSDFKAAAALLAAFGTH